MSRGESLQRFAEAIHLLTRLVISRILQLQDGEHTGVYSHTRTPLALAALFLACLLERGTLRIDLTTAWHLGPQWRANMVNDCTFVCVHVLAGRTDRLRPIAWPVCIIYFFSYLSDMFFCVISYASLRINLSEDKLSSESRISKWYWYLALNYIGLVISSGNLELNLFALWTINTCETTCTTLMQ